MTNENGIETSAAEPETAMPVDGAAPDAVKRKYRTKQPFSGKPTLYQMKRRPYIAAQRARELSPAFEKLCRMSRLYQEQHQ